VQTDLDILAALAEQLHEHMDDLKNFDLPDLVRLIRRTLLRELDFKRESRNIKIARTYAGETPFVYIPEVYEEYCTDRVLVMELVQGSNLSDFNMESLEDAALLANQGLVATIDQILRDGFFHADPHPGNVLITEGGQLCLIDWGMTGRLSQRDRHQLISFLKAVLDKDGEAMVYTLLRICHAEGAVDQKELEREMLDILDFHYAVPIKEMNIGRLLMAVVDLLRTYRLRLPPDLVIMVKALFAAEGTARRIYPELDVVTAARGRISRMAVDRYKPESLWRGLRFTVSQLFSLQKDLPKRIDNILGMMDRGEMTLGFRHENLTGLMSTLENITNRLTFGIIIAAIIIGSSMIITTGVKPFLFGFPVLGVIGYLISALLGIWLLVNIIRARKY
jgi:ubiquinone biosynthesis protein